MSTKTISLSEEVYTILDAERREGESFNGVITRLTEEKSLMNIVGFLKEGDAEEMWKVIEEMREKSRDRTLRILALNAKSAAKAGEVQGKLIKEGKMIDPEDAMIAGIALFNNEIILTKNVEHFYRI